jgi:hypothetical protein
VKASFAVRRVNNENPLRQLIAAKHADRIGIKLSVDFEPLPEISPVCNFTQQPVKRPGP